MVKELIEQKNTLEFEYTPLNNPPAVQATVSEGKGTERQDWPTLHEMENRYIRDVLKHCKGKLTGTGSATSILDIHYTTLKLRMKELGIASDVQGHA